MTEPQQVVSQRRTWRSTRALLLFLACLSALALCSVYAATVLLVRVDNVVLPGVDVEVPLPKPVAKVLPSLPSLPGLVATPVEGSPGTTRINVLVLGLDRRPNHDPKAEPPPNSDSMHLLSIDPVTRTAVAIALPRDLYVEMPSPQKKGEFIAGRINSAYSQGELYKYPGGGAALAKRTVEYNFRVPIDYYMVVDWAAFADVIEALGGVWINVPKRMANIEGVNPHDGNAFRITLNPGWQYMDAVGALAYARFRDDEENDFGRIRRQQEVMRAAADEALRRGWLTQGPQLYSRFRSAVDTDLPLARLPGLFNLIRLVGIDRVTMVSLAGENTEAVRRVITPYGEDVLVPIWEKVAPIMRAAITDPDVVSEGASVTVINATGVRGQDQKAVEYLARFSIPAERIRIGPVPPGTLPGTVSNASSITYSGAAVETAQRVAQWLGLPSERIGRVESGLPGAASVTVTLGKDVRLPDDERFNGYRPR